MGELAIIMQSLTAIREDIRQERIEAKENRAHLHNRIDDLTGDLGEVRRAIATSTVESEHLHEQVRIIDAKVDRNHGEVKPTIEEWKRIKAMGIGVGGLLALGGLSLGSAILYAGDVFWTWLKHKIGGA